MDSTASNHSNFFTLAIEDKIEEMMEIITERSKEKIEELIPIIRSMDVDEPLNPNMGATDEQFKNPGALVAEMLRSFSDEAYSKELLRKSIQQAILVHCRLFKIDPKTMSDEEIREKERMIFKRSSKYVAAAIRHGMLIKKQGFIDAMAAAPPTTRPKTIVLEYMSGFYKSTDITYDILYRPLTYYLDSLIMNENFAQTIT
jgi:hypothetical protein